MKRRTLVFSAALAPLASAALAQAPQRFPTKPITLWLPWPAGGATDLTFRVLAEAVGRRLGQKVLIENRGGAGGTLAMPVLQRFKARLDHRRYSGGALLGLRGLVFKAHGSSDAFAFEQALNRAYDAARHRLLDRVHDQIAATLEGLPATAAPEGDQADVGRAA